MSRKRLVLALATLAVAVPTGAGLAGSANAAPPACEPGAPGCKTGDDPDKNNPKFTETQRGNLSAPGTENTCVGTNPGGQQKSC
jgi:hypothetical protein